MKTRDIVLTALFAALTAIGAFIRIPTPWSSFTLEVFFVCMAGILLGPKLGALSQVIYVALGLVGLPIFTNGGGIGYVFKPTFGFLLGFIAAAFVIGLVNRGSSSPLRIALSCVAGLAVIYAVGLPYMAFILNAFLGKSLSFTAVLWAGMIPFLPFDALKIAVATILCRKLVPVLGKAGSGG